MRRPPASTLIASLALFFALGGTAIAARHYLVTSTSQIKPSVLKQLRGHNGTQGLAGPQGPAGPQGSPGQPGSPGPTNVTYVAGVGTVAAGTQAGGAVSCPVGQVVSGGGAYANSASPLDSVAASYPRKGPGSSTPNEWSGWIDNLASSTQEFTVYAICVTPTNVTVAPSFIQH
jgi:hypothetical protein